MEAFETCEGKHVRNWQTSAGCPAGAFQPRGVIIIWAGQDGCPICEVCERKLGYHIGTTRVQLGFSIPYLALVSPATSSHFSHRVKK